jgi:hypothetical protein
VSAFTLVDVPVGPPDRSIGFGLLSISTPTLRRFSDEALQAQVDKVLAGLDPERRGAELEVGVDSQGVALVVAVRLTHGWSIRGGISYDPGATWGGKVGIRWQG